MRQCVVASTVDVITYSVMVGNNNNINTDNIYMDRLRVALVWLEINKALLYGKKRNSMKMRTSI